MNDVARDLADPRTGKSVWQVMKDDRLKEEKDSEKRKAIDSRKDLRIGALGSGSDYTVFIDHLTIPSVNLSFRGEGGGVYHSIYDSFDWYRRFGDPDFVYGRALAQFNAVALARVADAVVLPFEFTNLADTISLYLDEIEKLQKEKQPAAGDTASIEPLRKSLQALKSAAESFEQTHQRVFEQEKFTKDPRRVNTALRKVEQSMRLRDGLPQREWYRHALYAPGFYTGYGVKTIPGVREAIEQEERETAREQVRIVERILDAVTAQIQSAETELRALP
jgi:N-acetylated-alpha-linked acidic dipeptidase